MNKHIQLFSLLVLVFLGSCKKNNGLDSKDLLVYMQGDFGSPTNTITASLTLTPVAVCGNTPFHVQAYSTRQMAAAMQVTIAPDSQAVTGYNFTNGKKCLMMPANTY